MEILGLIPARGGSKGLPRKNLQPVADRPMIAWSIDAANESTAISRVVVSTDDDEIAEVARSAGAEVPFLRPAELAADDTGMVDVVRHAVDWFSTNNSAEFDALVLLQPTSPLRQAHHIDEAVALLVRTEADSVVSVVPVPHRFSPYSVMRERDGRVEPFWQGELDFDPTVRQQQPVLWARNGPAVLISRLPQVLDAGDLYGESIVPFEMTPDESIDIDDAFDLAQADWLLRRRLRSEPAVGMVD